MQVKSSSTLPKIGPALGGLSGLATPELVALAQAGRVEAFDPLYRRYGHRVLTYAYHLCGSDRGMAEDLASEVWIVAMNRIGLWSARGGDDDDFVRWLFGMVRVRLHQVLVSRFKELPATPASDQDWLLDAAGELRDDGGDSEYVGKQEMTARLHAEIAQLSPVCRTVLRMRLDGADYAEIAQATGLSARQIRDARHRAEVRLRRRLAGRLLVESMTEAEREQLRQLATELPVISREVALLRLEGMAVPQIAAALGMSQVQASNAWRHAEDLLRKLLDDPSMARRPGTGRVAVWGKERDRLRAAAVELSPATRRVALLRLDGMTHTQIAKQLNYTPGGVASLWRDALDHFTRRGLIAA